LDLSYIVAGTEHSIQGCHMPINNNRKSADFHPSIPTGLIFVAWAILMLSWPSENYTRKSYSEFIQQVEAGDVAKATIDDKEIRYELKTAPETPAKTKDSPAKSILITRRLPEDPELAQILRTNRVEHAATVPNPLNGLWTILSWVGIPLVFLVLWSKFTSGNRASGLGMLGIGDSHAKAYSAGDTGVTFNDVAGIDEAKAELQEIVDFLKHAEKYVKLGAKIPKGVLLVGPPGTGKTLLAKAIAGEAGVPFFSISGSEFIEMFVGVGAARVRGLFEQAKQQTPCIVFIDELDALGKSRASANSIGGNDEREQTLNQLLSEMDGFAANTGVILLSATNRPEILDPALLRPGRFDRQIVVDRPDKIGRHAILLVHVRQVQLAADVDLLKIATRTPGFAGADLANLINEAALLAARRNQESVAMADFEEAIERLLAGLEKKSRVLNDLEKETVAYHEVGHAIVGSLMPGAGSIEKISIVPRGVAALGYTLQLPQEDRFLMVEDELRGQIAILLGGRSAEELIMGKVSTGASDDIQKATDLADRYVSIYGMSKQLGPMAFVRGASLQENRSANQFLGGYSPRRPLSPQVEATIDRGIKNLIDHAHHAAQEILAHNEPLLRQMAGILQEHEILEGQELHAYLQQVQKPPLLDKWLQTGELEINYPINAQLPMMGNSHNQSSYEYSHS
jgi:cell division protease FtsH